MKTAEAPMPPPSARHRLRPCRAHCYLLVIAADASGVGNLRNAAPRNNHFKERYLGYARC